MPDRDICAACRNAAWGFMSTSGGQWLCPRTLKHEYRVDPPPKGCKRMLEQAMSAALKTVNVDKNS